jgi:hypothetical protein
MILTDGKFNIEFIVLILLPILLLLLFCMFGCNSKTELINPEKSCRTNYDCACGTHITTGDCFVGNKSFVNVEKQCPDFCTGIAGNFDTICMNNTCVLEKNTCRQHNYYECPDGCVVCPPCEVCSSISCETEDFCKGLGFDKSWYANIVKTLNKTN